MIFNNMLYGVPLGREWRPIAIADLNQRQIDGMMLGRAYTLANNETPFLDDDTIQKLKALRPDLIFEEGTWP